MHEQSEILNTLRDLLKWNVVTSYAHVKETLTTVLARPSDRLVYHLTDGKRSGLTISEESGISNAAISVLQNKWTKMGLMRKDSKVYVKQFDLEDFDIEVPDAASVKTAKASKKRAQE